MNNNDNNYNQASDCTCNYQLKVSPFCMYKSPSKNIKSMGVTQLYPLKVSLFWDALYVCKGILILFIILIASIFTALHGMQTRSSEENSVCPSVCLSVTRVDCDKTEERSVQIFIPYERTFSLVFWEEEWLVGGDPF